VGETRNARTILFGNLKGRDVLADLEKNGRKMLKWILNK
jgi:hypothetical protein